MPPTEDKSGDVNDSFYEKLECAFNKFLIYHMKILGDFNAKVGKKATFIQATRMTVYMKLVMTMELEY
jgi:hypothetical protein